MNNETTLSSGAQMFANRLRKNQKHLSKWLKRDGVSCYRLYDADMPEYCVAVDVYQGLQGEGPWLHVQEYEAPKSIDPQKADQRLQEAIQGLLQVINVPQTQLFLKVRKQQKGSQQYEKLATTGQFYIVAEGGHKFWVNFTDYLDTGLFLDHRITRSLLAPLAAGKKFLNLFAYTGSATVYAAAGGARSTTTVDMSNTYLEWAQRNMALNEMQGKQHEFVQADCLQWLRESVGWRRYGLIFLDPPSFSTSKRMQGTFDVQRDHAELISACMKLLEPGGVLLFSNNRRTFAMEPQLQEQFALENISARTLPTDFARNPRIHNAWLISHHKSIS